MPAFAYVIAISGFSGAGKSTAAENLTGLLGDAVTLGIDEYAEDATYPPAIEWIKNGANPDKFVTPQFVESVRALKEGRSIIHPENQNEIRAPSYVIVEEPFGKSRTAMRPLIDFHVQIEIPLEIALARRVLRIMERTKQNEDDERLEDFLDWYLQAGRDFYIAVRELAAKDTDLIIDGALPSETIAQKIFDAVTAKRASQNP